MPNFQPRQVYQSVIPRWVKAASTANVAGSYTNNGGGNGKGSFTGMPNTLDGVSLALSDHVLLKNQTDPTQNGMYWITTLGSGANGVWERSPVMDSDLEISGGFQVHVEQGTANGRKIYMLSTAAPVVVGGASSPSNLTFQDFLTYIGGTAGGGGGGNDYNAAVLVWRPSNYDNTFVTPTPPWH